MMNQILVYTLSNFSGHPMTILENIDILSLKTSEKKYRIFLKREYLENGRSRPIFFMFVIKSPAPKESFDGSIAQIAIVLQFTKMSTKTADTDQYLWFSTKYQLRLPIGSHVYHEVSFLWHYMIK